ncbi:MAG TPA: hypothetical protein VHM70_10735, partial [Polyangiaceae bacterium]|nr:hypothetical protein [Polyangiaceae bacterium]
MNRRFLRVVLVATAWLTVDSRVELAAAEPLAAVPTTQEPARPELRLAVGGEVGLLFPFGIDGL